MKIFLKSTIFISIIVIVPFLQISVNSQTQFELNKSACDKYGNADKELNKIYKRILVEYKSNTTFIRKFKVAQKVWKNFRDAHIELIFPGKNKHFVYGSVFPMCNCIHLTNITIERIEQLKVWIDGIKEGDVCSGSIKTK